MSGVLREIVVASGRTRDTRPATVIATYIDHPASLKCTVAVGPSGDIQGFQSILRAGPEGLYGVEPGWGVIGTHISPRAARRGLGAMLFNVSRAAAAEAGLAFIDATVRTDNAAGLAFYSALGFRPYGIARNATRMVFALDRS